MWRFFSKVAVRETSFQMFLYRQAEEVTERECDDDDSQSIKNVLGFGELIESSLSSAVAKMWV